LNYTRLNYEENNYTTKKYFNSQVGKAN